MIYKHYCYHTWTALSHKITNISFLITTPTPPDHILVYNNIRVLIWVYIESIGFTYTCMENYVSGFSVDRLVWITYNVMR